MGILRFQDISDSREAAIHDRLSVARDLDDAGPIGRRALLPIDHQATSIKFDPASGRLVYGPELKIGVYRGHEKLLPEPLQRKLGMREIRGWLFQVRKARSRGETDPFSLLQGKEILFSKLPHSRNYFVRRKLKPCKHEKAVWAQVERAWDKYRNTPLMDERLDRVLQELSVTPFVSFKDCQAAWAVSPKRFDVLGTERFDTHDDYTVAALDIPFEDAYELLLTEGEIQDALTATEEGRLFESYRSIYDVMAAVRAKIHPGTGPVYRSVTEGLYENRGKLMEAACWAALCGRETPDTGDWVVSSAVRFYHRFAYSFVKREENPVRRPRRGVGKLEDRLTVKSAEEIWSDSLAEEETIREYTEQWRKLGCKIASAKLKLIIGHVLQADKSLIDQDFVGSMRPPLAGWPPQWKRPDGLQEALQRLSRPGE
jgi:hypothetical protein